MSFDTDISPNDQVISDLRSENAHLKQELRKTRNELKQIQEALKALDTIPLQIGTVIELMKKKNMALVMIKGSNQMFRVTFPKSVKDEDLFPGTLVTLHPKTLAITGFLPQTEDSYVRAMEVIEKPSVTFDDIGGLNEEIMQILEAIELSLVSPELFIDIGIDPPKGILLFGPPGTGKTLIAKAISAKTNARFVGLAAPELAQKFIGDGARLVREIFQFARRNAPAVIFIDEIDAIAMRRSDYPTEGNTEIHRTFLQLLAELDGFNERGNVKFIAATNRPDVLDKAITRPGRFDRQIDIGLPTLEGRKEIFIIHSKRMKLDDDVDFDLISKATEDFNGAEIKAVCTEAGMFAIREKQKKINMNHFQKAIEKVKIKDRSSIYNPSNQFA
ncbi:MAG: AAA family ATPase [Candidatus Heimdallarchaeota archaeon]